MQPKKSRLDRILRRRPAALALALALVALLAATAVLVHAKEYLSGKVWAVPRVVDPGPPGGPPSDAVVLIGSKGLLDLSKWKNGADWIAKDGYVIGAKTSLVSKDDFGDCQLHVEWAEPAKIEGEGQGRGNSGVFMMSLYEVQVLDSYDNPTYPDGQCGSLYKEIPPLVNVNRKPGQWQTYDIVWHGPRFDAAGKLTRKATITVLQNGVLVLDHFELLGRSYWDQPPSYEKHPEKLPLLLQYHDNPVCFRNVWIRELDGPPQPKN